MIDLCLSQSAIPAKVPSASILRPLSAFSQDMSFSAIWLDAHFIAFNSRLSVFLLSQSLNRARTKDSNLEFAGFHLLLQNQFLLLVTITQRPEPSRRSHPGEDRHKEERADHPRRRER